MNPEQLRGGRLKAGLKQTKAAQLLGLSQPYLSQLETGSRLVTAELACKVAAVYELPPTALPLTETPEAVEVVPKTIAQQLAALGYPGFSHVRFKAQSNPAEVVFSAVVKHDLDVRLVEALPWVMATYTDLNWPWLRDNVKVRNAQNRLGYLVHLAREKTNANPEGHKTASVLSNWKNDLEQSRLAVEGTLCRDSMPEHEREWLKGHRPKAAAHWNLLTSLTPEQLPYVIS